MWKFSEGNNVSVAEIYDLSSHVAFGGSGLSCQVSLKCLDQQFGDINTVILNWNRNLHVKDQSIAILKFRLFWGFFSLKNKLKELI